MKKVYTILAFLLITGIAFAQKTENPRLGATKIQITNQHRADYVKIPFSNSKAVSDTIGLAFWNILFDQNAYYLEPGMGYPTIIQGTDYGFTNRIYQEYYFNETLNTGNYTIKEVLIYFQAKTKLAVAGTVSTQKVYLNLINSDSSYTVLDSASFTIDDIDTSSFFTVIPLIHGATASLLTGCLGICVNLADMGGTYKANQDSAHMTVDIQAGFPKSSSYTRTDAPGSTYIFFYDYHQMYTMFVVADDNTGIVGGNDYIEGMQVLQNYPNPAVDGVTSISYSVNKPMKISLQVLDNTGKVVEKIDEGYKGTGTYVINLSKKLAPGLYYYSLIGNGQFLTKKMVIE